MIRNLHSPVVESMQAREPGLQALSNLAGSKIKNTHVFFPSLTLSQKSNIGKSTCHVSCLYFEGKAIKLTKLKLSAKYAFSQAPSNLKNRLAGSRGDSRTGLQGLWQSKYGPTEFQGSRGRPTGSHMAQEWARGSQGVMW